VTVGTYTSHTHTHTHTHVAGRCVRTADLCAPHGDGEGPAIPEGHEVGLHPFRPMLHAILCAKAVLHPHGHPARIHSCPAMFTSLLALVTSSRADTGLLQLTVKKAGHIRVPASHSATGYVCRPMVETHLRRSHAEGQCNTAGSTWLAVLLY